jgi:hypothetical protein
VSPGAFGDLVETDYLGFDIITHGLLGGACSLESPHIDQAT